MARVFEVEVTIPTDNNPVTNAPYAPGDSFTIQIEEPARETKARGQLWGIELKDMTDDQLKREIINAGSVLYKATQRGAAADVIAKNQARLDAAKAEKERRSPAPQGTVVTGAVVANAAAPAESEGNTENLNPAENANPAEGAESPNSADNIPAEEKPAEPKNGKNKGKGTTASGMDNKEKTDEKLAGEI